MENFYNKPHKSQPPKISAWIDIHCEIQAVPFAQLSQMAPGETSETIRARVIAARKMQEDGLWITRASTAMPK